jgi:thiol-disulfide isomerase/thioredoxin
MKRLILLAYLLAGNATILGAQIGAQTSQVPVEPRKQPEAHLLGKTSIAALRQAPFAEWFEKGFRDYTPATDILTKLSAPDVKRNLVGVSVRIFFGSWCGDSKREMPRFLKTAQMLGLKEEQIELIGVDQGDSTYKRSPTGEERAYNIFRVPTFVFLQNGSEVQRITEYPAESHERDILTILKRQPYTPNYFSYGRIVEWLSTGVLADTNVSPAALAGTLRRSAPVSSEGELNGCAYVLLARGQVPEAVAVFRINAILFPQSSNCFESLAEGYERLGNKARAVQCCERALELDSKNTAALNRLVKLKSTL